ncbi:cation-transporting P-type ATPase [Candidatus Woesearchaeota archaeon]|nr:cation-transporting P-type ATPase [Candidatus Woesearchaeota archaeon]
MSEKEVKDNFSKYGYNEIREVSGVSPVRILLRQIKKNLVVYLLFFAMLISFFVGKIITAYTILGVLIIVISVSFFQEYKAESAIEALKKMIMPVSIVIRNGKEKEIPTKEIVPGDIILLRTGEKVPADCIIFEEKDLKVNESILTGESKELHKAAIHNTQKHQDINLVFMGTFVTRGKATVQAMHTGMNTRFGKIAGMISTAEKSLPLQDKINYIIKYMVFSAIFTSLLTGTIMIVKNLPFSYSLFVETLVVALALSVAAFPEGFPVVLITALASGAHRMAKKNAIVNRMSIIETLGETTVICADKTGTITTGEMTVKKVFVSNKMLDVSGVGYEGEGNISYQNKKIKVENHASLALLLKTAVVCNDARIERKGTDKEFNVYGSQTESALLVLASKVEIYKDDIKAKRLEEIPFSSERKMMSVLVSEGKKNYVYSKGAPEMILKKCEYIQVNSKVVKMTKKQRKKLLVITHQLAAQSFRTLALAYKPSKGTSIKKLEEKLIFIGLVGMDDPPRDEVKESIELCRTAGIKVKMITGDNKETAKAIAAQIGLHGEILLGEELDELTDDELSKVIDDIAIFARVRPEHKLMIVRVLKQKGEIVTMTGDGVNDAPALKESHIGVAMGKNGTDVSRASSDLILKDDHFSTIVDAVKEGRTIFSNIQKFSAYQISINVAQTGIVLLSVLFGLPLPLIAIQILLMNIISDEITAITLAFNPYSKDVMNVKPRKKTQLINKSLFIMIIIAGLVMAAGALFMFNYIHAIKGESLTAARTSVFIIMTFFAIANAFNFRSFRKPVPKLDLLANENLILASIGSILVSFIAIYTPLRDIFGMSPISITNWGIAILISLTVIFAMDVVKVINHKYNFMHHST